METASDARPEAYERRRQREDSPGSPQHLSGPSTRTSNPSAFRPYRSLGALQDWRASHTPHAQSGGLCLQHPPIGRAFHAQREQRNLGGEASTSRPHAKASLPNLQALERPRLSGHLDHAATRDFGDRLAVAREHREAVEPRQEISEYLAKLTTVPAQDTKSARADSVVSEALLDHQAEPHKLPLLPEVQVEEYPVACRNVMATGYQRMSGDARRYPSSNFGRNENRPPMNNGLCRNGPQCRKFQEGTCNYNHDFSSIPANGLIVPKKSLNVESPAFTPTFTPKSTHAQPVRLGISPKSAAAAAFTPRGSGSVTPATNSHSKHPSDEFMANALFQAPSQFGEFVPGQGFLTQQQLEPQHSMHTNLSAFGDPFLSQPGLATLDQSHQQINPYTQQTSGSGNQQYFQDSGTYKHPLNYHLYASIGPRRDNLMAYQRSTSDFFIPDNLREDLQRKAEATLQTFANSTLPQSVEYFHSLVALDTGNQKGTSFFGYPSWVYKATSSRDGHNYALRRVEGFRLTNEAAIRTVQNWKRVSNSSLVQVHDAFTGRWFNDSSLIIVTDYHPLSQTLADKHFSISRHSNNNRAQVMPENEIWSYIVQIASALRSVHEGGLAAQTVTASKLLLTSKNRLRVNGCGILDIVQYDQHRPVNELQRVDLEDLGRLVLSLATRSQTAHHNIPKALDLVSRSYTERLRACIAWLLNPPPISQDSVDTLQQVPEYNINVLLTNIADKVVAAFDSVLHFEDDLTTNVMRELENGRLVRLLTKLNVILERPEATSGAQQSPQQHQSSTWSETGERYYLKLFRDYVFHQVDADGRPVLDLGHMVTCLNKLDAGIDEKMQLISRDEQNMFVVTYREVKRGFEAAWSELSKAATSPARR